MHRLIRLRSSLVVALALATVAPVTAQASAPEAAQPPTTSASTLGALVSGAARSLNALGEAIDTGASAVARSVDIAAGPCSGSGGLNYGSDGRLTILLLGSDYRKSPYIGERMDVIIVATRKSNGRIAMASIPRDTAYFPKATGGTSGSDRVNALYYRYKRNKSNRAGVDCSALLKLKRDVAKALATEIDYYAMVRMTTFAQLVDNVSFVRTDIPGPINDPSYARNGAYFPNKNDYKLVGHTACKKKPFECHSALTYVRSRHGTQAGGANNDFKRAYRQHQFIFDAAMRVRSRGSGSALSSLSSATVTRVWTNVPKNLSAAQQIYNLLGGVSMTGSDRIVLGPSTFATALSSPAYAYKLKLNKVRTWINAHFGS